VKRITCLALIAGGICSGAMAQSAGSLITSAGGTWMDFGPSSATALQSTSAAGTFTSPGTGGRIHNTFTAELAFTYFITDNIALDLATGVPPKLKLYAQGTAAPFGPKGRRSTSAVCNPSPAPERGHPFSSSNTTLARRRRGCVPLSVSVSITHGIRTASSIRLSAQRCSRSRDRVARRKLH
jgi:hypothetical protein